MKKLISLLLICCVLFVQMSMQTYVHANEYECIISEAAESVDHESAEEDIRKLEIDEYEDEKELASEEREVTLSDAANVISPIEKQVIAITPFAGVVVSGTVGASGASWTLYDDGTLVVYGGMIQWNDGENSPWAGVCTAEFPIVNIIFTEPIAAGTHLRGLFANLTRVETIQGLYNFDTGSVISMASMFAGTSSLISLDMSGWDTGNVTHMSNMFYNASSLVNIEGMSDWDTSNVTHMNSMFDNASSLESLDLSGWNTENVRFMGYMFSGASSLESVGDLSGWNTGNVTYMHRMFEGASSLEGLNLSGWNTVNVVNMYRMFYYASSLVELDVSGWNTANVTNMADMFYRASSLPSLDLSDWDTGSVALMQRMFLGASSLAQLNISDWDTSAATNMSSMFLGASSLTNLDLSDWDTGNVGPMNNMFYGASSLESVGDLSNWNTGSVTNMRNMFAGASSLESLDLSGWDVGSVNNMQQMFNDASSLTSVGDLSGWNTGNVTTMHRMFEGASSLESLDLSGWNTENVTQMSGMFRNMNSLEILNLEGWSTSGLTVMSNMFLGAVAIRELTLGEEFSFVGSPALPAIPANTIYTGSWQNVGTGTVSAPTGTHELTSAQLMATFDGSTMADTWVWQRALGILLSEDHVFPSAEEGYGAQTSFTATVTNIGVNPTGNLTISLSGPDQGSFTLSTNMIDDIAAGANANFTIVPNIGLAVGTHTATVTVSDSLNNISESITVSFTVTQKQTFGISLSGYEAFPSIIFGQRPPPPFNVTVTNIGNQPTGSLIVELSGEHASSFTISLTALPSIDVGESIIDAFAVAPNANLPIGVHRATITVSGGSSPNDFSESFEVSFSVTAGWGISLIYDRPFPPAILGYAQPPQLIATVTNVGNQPTGSLVVALSGQNADSFNISTDSLDSVVVGDSINFIVTPNIGLPVGTYIATITVTGENGISASFNVSFTVNSGNNNNNDTDDSSDPDSDRWIGGGTGTVATQTALPPIVLGYTSFIEDHIAYIVGFPDGTFRPSQAITRAEIAMILFRLLDSETKYLPQASRFNDIQVENWYAQAVNYLAGRNILVGYHDATFRPNDSMSRAELAAVMSRFFELEQSDTIAFYDVDFNHWAFEYIMNAEGRGWISGYGDRTFRPDNAIIRAEAVTLINRVLGRTPNPATIDQHLMGVTVFSDITSEHWAFYQIMEASIEHEFQFDTNGLEVWTHIISLPPHEAR